MEIKIGNKFVHNRHLNIFELTEISKFKIIEEESPVGYSLYDRVRGVLNKVEINKLIIEPSVEIYKDHDWRDCFILLDRNIYNEVTFMHNIEYKFKITNNIDHMEVIFINIDGLCSVRMDGVDYAFTEERARLLVYTKRWVAI